MALVKLNPKSALNKAYLKVKPNRAEMESFKSHLISLLDKINESESEEFHKNLVTEFLKKSYYDPDYYINTKGRNDLVIHNGKDAKNKVAVIVEAKKPTNKAEMLKCDNINVKAFQELVLYYFRERITNNNLEIKCLVATNINEWFIFDAAIFEKNFSNNKVLVKQFIDFEDGRLSGTNTDFFYNEIARPAITAITTDIEFTYFDIRDYEKPLRNTSKQDDNKLIALFKLLSPEHLLKLPFLNDSNSLDKSFYSELLHIIGLTETKNGSKKLIQRKEPTARDSGSLLENVIDQIEAHDRLIRLSKFGADKEQRLFNAGLALVIIWVNRILFLKLLEAQLLAYHNRDTSYAFLNQSRVANFDDLNSLFFQVLACRSDERKADIKKLFGKVPYLNSSLFEPTELEAEILFISNLKDEKKIPILASTVLKDSNGKKRKGELNTLQYLFEFLDAYDFASEGAEEIQEENKSLINASVLGLIFEKINGYKDGSFFTPGFVTMYMSRETIRRAVIQKFNEVKGWQCQDIDDLYEKIADRNEANVIINSIKICDPAVGSGHFLVSALNELIAIKSDLKILQDRNGRRLKEYHVEVVNDELIVTDEDGEFFEYKPANAESQRIQEALFHEKQTIIENCLFGVDINPNSVKICRLRLWIELLKNAYYKNDHELETLPNIDINIKSGNSLISRFSLDTSLRDALKKSKLTIPQYKSAVQAYKNARTKDEKREMAKLISEVKAGFRTEIPYHDPKVKSLENLRVEIKILELPQSLLGETKEEKRERAFKRKKLEIKADKLDVEIAEIKSNKIYENAFEWRFEFPEVLNETGEYLGFDAIIGNPPYIDSETMINYGLERERNYISKNYNFTKGNWDIYIAFFERGINLLKKHGSLIYITPDKWISKPFGDVFRENCLENFYSITKLGRDVFESAIVDSIITTIHKVGITQLKVNQLEGTTLDNINSVEKVTLSAPYTFDCLLSKKLVLLTKIEGFKSKLSDLLVCESACATSDAYKLKEFMKEFDFNDDVLNDFYKVVNTGTLDKYIFKWASKQMTYLKDKYNCPVVHKEVFDRAFKNSYFTKTNSPKLIVKGLTKLDVAIDVQGNIIPGKSTLIFISDDQYKLKLVAGILNSQLVIEYIKEKYSAASYNGGIVFTKDMLNNLPLKLSCIDLNDKIVEVVDDILLEKTVSLDVDSQYRLIDMYVFQLYQFEYSEIESLVNEVGFTESEYNSLIEIN